MDGKYCSNPECKRWGHYLPLSEFSYIPINGTYASWCRQCVSKKQSKRSDYAKREHAKHSKKSYAGTVGRAVRGYTKRDHEQIHLEREARKIIHDIIQREQERSGYSESWARHNRVPLVRRAIESGEIAGIYSDLSEEQYDRLIQAIEARLVTK